MTDDISPAGITANQRTQTDRPGGPVMTKTPKWLPDGSGIDPESLDGDNVVETVNGFRRGRRLAAELAALRGEGA